MGSRSARTGSEAAATAALLAATMLAGDARAAHPLITEDTGTQGAGRFELELGFADTRGGAARASEFGPQLSWGAAGDVDLIARPAWLDVRSTTADGSTRERYGATALDVKWRFREADGLSAGTRAGIGLPTGGAARSLLGGRPSFHAVLIGQAVVGGAAMATSTLIANVGYASDPVAGERAGIWYGTAAAVVQPTDGLRLSAEAAAFSPQDPSRASWPAVARFGAIAAVAPWLDVDVGIQFRLNRAADLRALLVGATLRW